MELPICEFVVNFIIDHWFMCIIIGIYILGHLSKSVSIYRREHEV